MEKSLGVILHPLIMRPSLTRSTPDLTKGVSTQIFFISQRAWILWGQISCVAIGTKVVLTTVLALQCSM